MDLEFPTLDSPLAKAAHDPANAKPLGATIAQPTTAIAVQAVTLKGAALAHFDALEAPLRALAERYRAVAFDVSTPKGLTAAKKAREDLRENGRYAVQRAEADFKTAVNDAKKAVAPKVEQLVAIIKPVEDHVDGQIKAREAEIEAEKQREQARKAAHLENVAMIAGWAQRAHGQPADKLAGAIKFVQDIDVSAAAFEEYAPAAEKAKADVLAKLQQLHEEAVESARVRAENEARERTIRAIASINAHVAGGIGEGTAALSERLVSLKALVPATDAAGEVMTAYLTATAQIEAMLEQAQQREDLQRQLDEARASQAAAAPAPAPVAPPEPEKPAQEPESAAAEPSIMALLPGRPLRFVDSENFGVVAIDAALPVDSGGTGQTGQSPDYVPGKSGWKIGGDTYQPSEAIHSASVMGLSKWFEPAGGEVAADVVDDEPNLPPARGPVRIVAVLPPDAPIPTEAEARLIAAEALARQVGACQIAPETFAFDLGQLADLIDAARA